MALPPSPSLSQPRPTAALVPQLHVRTLDLYGTFGFFFPSVCWALLSAKLNREQAWSLCRLVAGGRRNNCVIFPRLCRLLHVVGLTGRRTSCRIAEARPTFGIRTRKEHRLAHTS